AQRLTSMAQQPPQMSPDKKAELQIEAMNAQANIESKRAGAIANLAKAGIRQPGASEEIMKSAVDALLTSGQSAQDHGEAMQQQVLDHAHEAAMAQQQQDHERNIAAMQP